MTEPLAHGGYYHIYNRGINRENIFKEERNYAHFLKLYAKHIAPVADTFAYCLMRNHFYLSIRTKTVAEQVAYWRTNLTGLGDESDDFVTLDPSQRFSNLFNAYTKSINKAYGRTGVLFQRPFGRIPIQSDAYYRRLVVYIHQNPQKHGFVEEFRTWPYSSYQTFLTNAETKLQRDEVIGWFGNRQAFLEAHKYTIRHHQIIDLIPEDDDGGQTCQVFCAEQHCGDKINRKPNHRPRRCHVGVARW